MTDNNPLLAPWTAPFGVPPFDRILPEHFVPAFEHAMRAHRDEVAAIGADPAPPDFANTIEAMQRSGRLLGQVSMGVSNLVVSLGSDPLQALDREMSPRLAQHRMAVALDPALFQRVDALHARRDSLGLDPEQLRLLERAHLNFVRSGAARRSSDVPGR